MSEERSSEVITDFGEILRHNMTIFMPRKGEVANNDTRLALRVVGWMSGRFVLTTSPYENGRKIKVETGKTHNITYLSKGKVYGFRAHLFREIQTMIPLLLFDYPQEVECIELRKEPRYTTFFAADISSETDGVLEMYKGTIINISKSGCFISLNQNTMWDVEHELSITFDMPTNREQYTINSIIRSVKRNKDKDALGIAFVNPSEDFKDQVDVIASVAEEAL
ncbi:MAG: PilZ domain-containing protein [Deltaproteobacteria bacterium]|nr:PilZ domain-containing protein [Deltaproteobacteria bacterium]